VRSATKGMKGLSCVSVVLETKTESTRKVVARTRRREGEFVLQGFWYLARSIACVVGGRGVWWSEGGKPKRCSRQNSPLTWNPYSPPPGIAANSENRHRLPRDVYVSPVGEIASRRAQ
jgi:hypothetical protein